MFRFNLRENLPLKIFSFLLALLCWVVVRSEESRIRNFVVPLDYVNLPESLELSGTVVETAAVRLRAPEAVMRSIPEDSLLATIDLSNKPSGRHNIRLSDDLIRIPAGAAVERISPTLVPIRLEKRVAREVPVKVEFAGKPAPGYRKVRHVIEPPRVTIEGPESEVKTVRRVLTGTISLEGETGDLDLAVQPAPDAPAGSRVRVVAPPGAVRVLVTIEPISPPDDGAAENAGKPRETS
jgi:YbbR domain-containing protein